MSANCRRALGNLIRVGPMLAVAGAAGFALAACGGGGGSTLATRTSVPATSSAGTVAQSEPTRTRTLALPTTTAPTTETTTTAVTTTTTTAVTTTAPGPTTTRPAIIVTTATQSTTVPVPVAPTATTSTASSSNTPWGWIIFGIVLAALLIGIGVGIWRRRRTGASAWSARAADLNRRCLLALDDVLAQGSVVTGQIQALASEAQSLEAGAPDDRSRATAAQVRARLDDLARVLESDRTLRLGSAPASPEQISYSTALIRQQAEQLQAVLRTPTTGERPT